MKVLGIDPGTLRTGWGVVERQGSRLGGTAAGVISQPGHESLEARLSAIYDQINEVVAEHRPSVVAVEDIFFGRYANAALKLGHVRGIILLAAAQAGLNVAQYPPAVVKRTVGGRGGSDKNQIAQLVAATLRWTSVPASDAADALAIAITHARAAEYTRGLSASLRARGPRAPAGVRAGGR